MRILKKTVFLLLILSLMCVCAYAESTSTEPTLPETGDVSAWLYQMGGFPEHTASVSAASTATAKAKDAIKKGLLNADTYIDLRNYNLYYDTFRELFRDVINEEPELFYVTGRYTLLDYDYDWDREEFIIYEVEPEYAMEGEELAAAKHAFQTELNRILNYAAAGSTPLTQAMLVNDYFCMNYEYDLTYSIYDAYTLFTQKTGVCQAYMLGYTAALKKLGIPVATATSDAMNHTWNLVQIDGSWYHVDVTWNDPVPDQKGRACHSYFLRSDAGMLNNVYGGAHYDWVADNRITASSKKYDKALWCTSNAPLIIVGSQMYMFTWDDGTATASIVEYDGTNVRTLHSYSPKWYITTPGWEEYYYPANFGALGYYRNYLLFSTYDTVEALSLADGSRRTVYRAPSGVGIWESFFQGNLFQYGLGNDYNDITERGEVWLQVGSAASTQMLLPEDMVRIDAEAFAGSAVANVVAGSQLKRIESRAFANCTALETVELGKSVKYIAPDAFAGSMSVTIICPAGSYAEQYALELGIPVRYS